MIKNLMRHPWLLFLSAFAPVISFAEEHGAAVAASGNGSMGMFGAAFGAALGIGLAVVGAAGAQGRIAAAYMEGIARNPGAEGVMKTQLILSLVFVETLVIFTLGIVVMIVTKVG